MKQNRELTAYLEKVMSSYEQINESKQSVEKIFESIKEMLKNNKHFNKSREELSPSYSQYEYLGSTDIKTSSKTCNCNISIYPKETILNANLLKKIEKLKILILKFLKILICFKTNINISKSIMKKSNKSHLIITQIYLTN